MDKNKVDLRLIVCDFEDISHSEITKLLNVEPTYIRVKGERRNPRNANSPVGKAMFGRLIVDWDNMRPLRLK